MRAWLPACVVALLALRAGSARAQECNVRQGPTGRTTIINQGQPTEIRWMGGGVTFDCRDGRLIKADSVVMVETGQQRLLVGHAYYADKEKALSADQINYMGTAGHLFAQKGGTQGNVILTDNVNGAVITGDFLDYYPEKNGQPSRAQVYSQSTGTRPHAVLKRKPAPPAAGAAAPGAPNPADTAVTLVDADRMEIQGQRQFHAIGNVVLTRQDMKGTSQDANYDPDTDHLRMNGNAQVTGQDFALAGGTIDGNLVGNQFKDVTATLKATLTSKDLRVNAPSLTVAFDSGQVQRMVALSSERSKRTATDGQALAEAFARDFHLIADSIDARAPGQKLEQVVAVGHAYGERQNDSIKVKMPSIASKDWLKGDTITGFFIDAPPRAQRNGRPQRGAREEDRDRPGARTTPPAGPPAGSAPDTVERVLDRVVAQGTESAPASSMYRIVDDKKPQATPAISYLLAKRITVAFKDGEVREVSADGQIRGIHLQPEEPKQKPKEKAAPKNAAATPSATGSGPS
jgi:hypothetical protein